MRTTTSMVMSLEIVEETEGSELVSDRFCGLVSGSSCGFCAVPAEVLFGFVGVLLELCEEIDG